MLSLFPTLLSFQLIAPFLLRLTLGGILIHWSWGKFKNKKSSVHTILTTTECLAGILLVIGLWVQLAALVAVVIFGVQLFKKAGAKAFFTDGVNYYFLLFIIALSLLLLGPGIYALDLPL